MSTEPQRLRPGKDRTTAAPVIAGFRYQLLHSVFALITLGEAETLLLEVSEDFSVVGPGHVYDHQVKNSQAVTGVPAYSLQSASIRQCLSRFWEDACKEPGRRRLVFVARGGVAIEREFEFPGGQGGLIYWRRAAMDADTTPIRVALRALFASQPLGEWIASNPSDNDLRDQLLRRVNWQMDSAPADVLEGQIKDQLSPLFRRRGWPVSLRDQAARLLLEHTLEVASRPEAARRRLERSDLEEIVEEVAKGAWLANQIAPPSEPPATSEDALITSLDGLTPGARRTATVDQLLTQVRGQPLIWIHGAHGVGKSMLARLVAHRVGGAWLVVDLWPVHTDAASALAVWRELLRLIAEQPVSGIIIDDMVGQASGALASRVAALAKTFAPLGVRIIVTSHSEPSPARLADGGADLNASFQAPYFSIDDIAELVAAAPAPANDLVEAWSTMLQASTRGGHPVLVSAKLASLRARKWPDAALVEDLVAPASTAVRLTREEARRTLVSNLRDLDQARSLEAGQLLRRAASVFDRVDRALLLKLAAASPALPNAGDAVAILRGAWLEVLPHDDMRVSPLLADITEDVAKEDGVTWRRIAAEHWLGTRHLNERTLPLCFWNAFLGDHSSILSKLYEVLQTMDPAKLRGAAPLLAPLAFFRTDKPNYPSNPIIGLYLRHLQFVVADAIDHPDIAVRVAERFLVETDTAGEAGALVLTTAGPQILMSASVPVGPLLRMEYALRIRKAFRVAERLSEGSINEPRFLLPKQFGPELDFADFLFTTVVPHVTSSTIALSLFEALDQLEPAVRNNFVQAISMIYEGPSVFANCGWSNDQIADRDMRPALAIYDKIHAIVEGWNLLDVLIEVECARSVILDEGINDKSAALRTIEAAIGRVGQVPALVRQKAKVLAHLDRHSESADLVLSIEETVGASSSFERGLALRDGGVAAAKAGRFRDAVRLLEKAYRALLDGPDRQPLATGVLVEKALAQWHGGAKTDAVLTTAQALEALERFPMNASRQAERSHQVTRAMIGAMTMEPASEERRRSVELAFGVASQIEDAKAELLNVPLKPLADMWRLLVSVEAWLGVDLGLAARSIAKSDGLLLLSIERLILSSRYAAAVRSGTAEAALRAGARWLASTRLPQEALDGAGSEQRVTRAAIELVDPQRLLDANLTEVIQSLLLDLLAVRTLRAAVDANFIAELRESVRSVFGVQPGLEGVLDAAAQLRKVDGRSERGEMLAYGIGMPAANIGTAPRLRLHRDLMLVTHVTNSLARSELEAGTAALVTSGWKSVLVNQRFLLIHPNRVTPAIEAALAIAADGAGLVGAARVVVAAGDAVTHPFAKGWFDLLLAQVGLGQAAK